MASDFLKIEWSQENNIGHVSLDLQNKSCEKLLKNDALFAVNVECKDDAVLLSSIDKDLLSMKTNWTCSEPLVTIEGEESSLQTDTKGSLLLFCFNFSIHMLSKCSSGP